MKKSRKVPDLFIEKLLLGELPEHEKEQLLADPDVRRRVAELEASNKKILEEYRPDVMAQAIQWRRRKAEAGTGAAESMESAASLARKAARPRLGWQKLVPAVGFAVVALVAGFVIFTRQPSVVQPQTPVEEIRLKGNDAHLVVYRKTSEGSETLQHGDIVRQRDTLQIGYVSTNEGYGAIVSIDGRGAVTLHFPASATDAKKLESGGEVFLPFAYQLDDAPDFERFFLVTYQEPFALDSLLESARQLVAAKGPAQSQDLTLPDQWQQTSLLLVKE